MFCIQCGKELGENANFCAACGSRKHSVGIPSTQTVIQQPVKTADNKPQKMKALFVLSIIAICWHSTYFFSYLFAPDRPTVYWITFFVFGFAIAHSIVAVKMGNKHSIQQLKTMGIIGIILYLVSSFVIIVFVINCYDRFNLYQPNEFAGKGFSGYISLVLWGLSYPIAFSIISLIMSTNILKAVSSKNHGMLITAFVQLPFAFIAVFIVYRLYKSGIVHFQSDGMIILFGLFTLIISIILMIKSRNKKRG